MYTLKRTNEERYITKHQTTRQLFHSEITFLSKILKVNWDRI